MSIPELKLERNKVKEFFEKADKALSEGRITKKERDAFLQHHCKTTNKNEALHHFNKQMKAVKDGDGVSFAHRSVSLIAAFFVVMVSMFAFLFYSTGGITGAVVLNISVGQTYTTDAMIPVGLNGTTDVYIEGSATGAGDILVTLEHSGISYELYRYENGPVVTAHASLPKRQYLVGEDVIYNGTNVTSAYLMTETDAILLGNDTNISNLTVGDYTISLFINDTNLTQEQLDFTVVDASVTNTDVFDTCGEACNADLTGNGTINITVAGAELTLNQIRLESEPNQAPELVATVTDIVATDTVSLDLNSVFSEPDGDTMFFSSSNYDENDEDISNGVLTILGMPGTYSYVVYASDLVELTSSNMFTVTFTGSVIVNGTNTTNQTNVTPPIVNGTNFTVTNGTNTTGKKTPPGVCTHPDPNKRPVDCLLEDTINYFQEQTIHITNTDRQPVARITPIGNLLIKGDVLEQDTFRASSGDYVIGYEDGNGNFVVTVWFETSSGDLHLAGNLYEEELDISAPGGSFVLRNKKGITLAWADTGSGDLHVRGNVITRRGDIS